MKNEIFIIHGTDYRNMAERILKEAGVAEKIGDKEKTVGIKPNYLAAIDPSLGATTHPELLEGVLKYLSENGFTKLVVMEGAWVGARTADAVRLFKLDQLCGRYGAKFADMQNDTSEVCDCAGMDIKICSTALHVDYMINMPVLKGHCQTTVTCALKNNKGIIPNSEKRRFHTMGLHRPIAHLNTKVRNDFILVDNICGDLDFEEGGTPVQMDRVLGFFDPVLCDSFVCETMGYQAKDVEYIRLAEDLGVGSTDLSHAVIRELNSAPDGAVNPAGRSPRKTARLSAHVKADNACSACYGMLIHALARMEENGSLTKDHPPICIGQGYKGKTGDIGIGIGACTKGFAHHLPGCPPRGAKILEFLEKVLQASSRKSS